MAVDEFNPWQLVERSTVYDCRYFEVRRDTVRHAGGEPRFYNSVRMKYFGVAVAPIDVQGRVVLVGQYRYVLDRYTWEMPGGGALQSADSLDVAKAELKEETGCRARNWLKIVEGSASPGTSDEIMPGYVAWDLDEGTPQPDPEELLMLRRVPFTVAIDMALNGGIGNMVGVALLLGLHTKLHLGTLPAELSALLEPT